MTVPSVWQLAERDVEILISVVPFTHEAALRVVGEEDSGVEVLGRDEVLTLARSMQLMLISMMIFLNY